MITIEQQLMRSGLGFIDEIHDWLSRGDVSHNNRRAEAGAVLAAGDEIAIRGWRYRAEAIEHAPRLVLVLSAEAVPEKIRGLRRVHCGFHKCLTMYMNRILGAASSAVPDQRGFRHFFHRHDVFYRECADYELASISGHALELDRFEDIRVSRFIRDPRDMLVSGYFYHKRGAEHWCNYRNPVAADWGVINAPVPQGLGVGQSFSEYLNAVTIEEGLLAEMEFRQLHFDSIRQWPARDERIRCYRYEDIIGNETEVITDLLEFYDLSWWARRKGVRVARKSAAAQRKNRDGHIRNPGSGQWREHFTPAVKQSFERHYGDILQQLGYHWD